MTVRILEYEYLCENSRPEVWITQDGHPHIAISVLAPFLNECDLYAFVSLLRADNRCELVPCNWGTSNITEQWVHKMTLKLRIC